MSPDDIIQKLAERKAKYAAQKEGAFEADKAIWQTLKALDHPASYYIVLTTEQREQVRHEWTELATQLGVKLTPAADQPVANKTRKAPPMPPSVLEFFGEAAACLPHWPRATDDYSSGTYPCGWMTAATLRSVQLNPPAVAHWLMFDCDHADTERWRTVGLPEPSFATVNPINQHHHVVYKLSAPVCISERGRSGPKRYLRAVQEALRAALGADPAYGGLLTKNPLHPSWHVTRPEGPIRSYSLAELATGLNLKSAGMNAYRTASATTELAGVGVGSRNRALFDSVRCWAYAHSTGPESILDYARQSNSLFECPLSDLEVRGISKSVSKFCESNRLTSNVQKFRTRQAARGRKGGRPRVPAEAQPWAAAGVSRATWYRRLKSSETWAETI